jgi:hypothetical protein
MLTNEFVVLEFPKTDSSHPMMEFRVRVHRCIDNLAVSTNEFVALEFLKQIHVTY